MRPEGLGKLEKIHLIGTRSRDLPVCKHSASTTTLPRAPLADEIAAKNMQPHSIGE
jgi:hypothetical protein